MINRPRGTSDVYGKEMEIYDYITRVFRNEMNKYNYKEIITPIFESKDLFVRSVGETSDVVSKEMYEFKDRKDREFVLRPEGTAGTVRAVIENKMYVQNNLPLKLFYIGSMFRYERPQAGRQRQFNQLGVESFGADDLKQDAEIILLGMNILKAIKLADKSTIHLNYLVSGTNREKYIADLKKYLSGFNDLCEDCKSRIDKNPLRVLDCKIDGPRFTDAPIMKDYLDDETKTRFEALVNLLKEMNFNVEEDNQLVRGLDYYTGMVFEIKYASENLGNQATVIGGGRYNNLVQELGGPELPAAGFGLGIERIIFTIIDENISLPIDNDLDLFVIMLGETNEAKLKLVDDLRDLDLKVDFNLMNDSIKSGFKEAEKYNAKNVIVLGDNEIKDSKIKIKNQKDGKETEVSLSDLNKIKEIVKESK